MKQKAEANNQRGATLIEIIIAMVLLSILSVTTFGGILATTKVYGRKLEDFDDLERVYQQIEGTGDRASSKIDGAVTFTYGKSGKEVKVEGQYHYGMDTPEEEVVIVEFFPKKGE